MDPKKLVNPKSVGPGLWYSIHISALHATNINSKMFFRWYMDLLSVSIECNDCRYHLQKYMREHPIGVKEDLSEYGYFKWSVKLHNNVNERLGKPIVKTKDALSFFLNGAPMIDCPDCMLPPMVQEISSKKKYKKKSRK